MKEFFENKIFEKRVDKEEASEPFSAEKKESDQGEKNLELESYKQEAQGMIDSHQRFFATFAKDVSLSFKISNGFFIDLEKGEVNLDAKWFLEKGYSHQQILWACLHELTHFLDLNEDSEAVLKNFEYIKQQAKKTADVMLKKWEQKYGENDEYVEKLKKQKPVNPREPDGETMNSLEMSAYQIHHRFYNIFDDINDNSRVARKAPAYEEGESGGNEVVRLYREKLFKGNDYEKNPLHLQFVDKLIRDDMIPDEKAVVCEQVQDILERKIVFQGKEYTPTQIVENFIKLKKNQAAVASQRYFVLKKTLEPIFQDLLLEDLEKWDPQKPEDRQPGQGGKEEGGQSGNPFEQNYGEYAKNSPDQIDPNDMKTWQRKKDKEKKKKKEDEKKAAAQEGKTPKERAKESQDKMDRAWCQQNNLEFSALQQLRKIESEIEPYLQELSALWQKIIFGSSKKMQSAVEGQFKTGTEMDIGQVIEQWPKIAQQKFDDVRVMKRTVSREMLVQRPELIRFRLVGDMSGSMDEPKRHILQQCFVLLLLSLREFNTHLNLTRSQTKSKLEVDTEAWIFGDEAQKVKKLRKDSAADDEQVEIVRIFEKLSNTIGFTCDHEVLEKIQQSLSGEDLEKIAQKKILEIVLEVTDGGSTIIKNEGTASRSVEFSSIKTKRAVDVMVENKVIARGFQIGKTSAQEKKIFNEVWNDGRDEGLGEIVGENIANLLPAVASALKKYLSNVQL